MILGTTSIPIIHTRSLAVVEKPAASKYFSFEEPLELLPEWQFLLEQSDEGTAEIIRLGSPAHKK